MGDDDSQSWENATWEGNRRAQLRASLKLSVRQRFEALEDLAEISEWLAYAGRPHPQQNVVPREWRISERSVQEQSDYGGDAGSSAGDKQE